MLTERRTSAPFGSVRASYPDGSGTPEVQVTNPSGGVLRGDELEIEATLSPGSSATLLTQGATKVYRGSESSQNASFMVEDDAFLEYLPHHTIPYTGSSFRQSNTFDLAPDATLIAWEIVCAGRLARNERFAFDRLSSRTEILHGGAPLATDGFDLVPGDSPEPFGGASYLATLFVCAPEDLAPLASDLRNLLARDSAPDLHASASASASAPARSLCVVRVLAGRCPDLYRVLNTYRAAARKHLRLPSPARDVM